MAGKIVVLPDGPRQARGLPDLLRHYLADQEATRAPERLPYAVAWAVRTASLPSEAADRDSALTAGVQAARGRLSNRAWHLWSSDVPRLTAAARGALASMAPEARARLSAAAAGRLAVPFTTDDVDVLGAARLAATSATGARKVSAAAISRVPAATVVILAAQPGDRPDPVPLLPSEATRTAALVPRPDLAPLRTWIEAEGLDAAVTQLALAAPPVAQDAKLAPWITRLHAGELRDINPAHRPKAGEVPLDVLRAALIVHGRTDVVRALPAPDPDSPARTAAIVAAWPRTPGAAIPNEALDAFATEIETREARYASPLFQQAEAKRQAVKMKDRATVASEFLARSPAAAALDDAPAWDTVAADVRARYAAVVRAWGAADVSEVGNRSAKAAVAGAVGRAH